MKKLIAIGLCLQIAATLSYAEPLLSISPNPVKFGYISIGGSQGRELTLRNIGDEQLVIDYADSYEMFDVSSFSGLTIAPGDSATGMAYLNSESMGDYNAYFVFHYNNTSDPDYELPVEAHSIQQFEQGEIIWRNTLYNGNEHVINIIVVDDCNGDGLPDIIADGKNATNESNSIRLTCIAGSGVDSPQTIWSVFPTGGYSYAGCDGDNAMITCSDLNGDGHDDIIRGSAWNSNTVYAINPLNGATIWAYNTHTYLPTGFILAVDEIADLNGDGINEILAGSGSGADKVYCLNGATGTLIWRYNASDMVQAIAAIPDVNDDGYDDVVFGISDYGELVYCMSGISGDTLWIYDAGCGTYDLDIISDINADGYSDIIAGTWGNGIIALSGHSDDTTGTVIWNYATGNWITTILTCPDLNNDSYEDILVGSMGYYAEAVSGINGSSVWATYCGDYVFHVGYTDDNNGDGKVEVAAGATDYNLHFLDGASGIQIWGTYVDSYPSTVRGIDDINGDGYADIVIGTTVDNSNGGEVMVLAGGPGTVGITYPDEPLPSQTMITSNYPNPFNSKTIIKFNLDKADKYTISIYDILGRQAGKIEGDGVSGQNSVIWDAGNDGQISTGVYFYKVSTSTQSVAGKMTYLK